MNNTHNNILDNLVLITPIGVKEYIRFVVLHIVRLVEDIDNPLLKKSYQTLVGQTDFIHTKSWIGNNNGARGEIKSSYYITSDRNSLSYGFP